MTELQRDKKAWPRLRHGKVVQFEKRLRRRKERHKQNSCVEADALPIVKMPCLD